MKNSCYSIFLLVLLNISVSFSQEMVSVDSLLSTAKNFYTTHQDSALFYANLAHKKALQLRDTLLISEAISHKATYLLSKKQYAEAEQILDFNVNHSSKISKRVLGETYNSLGAIYSLREERDKALTQYFNAIDVFEDLEAFRSLARSYLNVGVIYENEGKLDQANFFYDKSLYFSKLHASNDITTIHDQVTQDAETSYEDKIKIATTALQTIENPEESRLAAVIYHDLSKNYIDHRQYDKAIASAQKSIDIKKRIGYSQNLDFCYFILGKSQVRLHRYDQGIANLKKAISLSEKRSLKPMMYDMLVLAYQNKQDFKNAYTYSRELQNIKDSIATFQENERIAEITSQYETEKQAKEILLLKQENQNNALLLSQKESRMWKWSLFALIVTLVAIFLGQKLVGSLKRLRTVEQEKEQIAKRVEEIAVILNNKSKVYLNQLKYIKSDGNYLEFVTNDKTIVDRNKLKDILDDLPPNFVRVHRSYVINKNFIDALNSTTLFLKPDIEIPLSRTFKSNLA